MENPETRLADSSGAVARAALAEQLMAPQAKIPLDRLAENWGAATLEASVPGHGALAEDLVLMNRIRGALGRELMAGASAQAIAGEPCPWSPPCALDILFREQARFGKHGIPKPFVLALDRQGFDLIVRVTLFGFAVEWAAVIAHALVRVLRGAIDFRDRGPDLFLPRPEVARLEVKEISRLLMPRVGASVMLAFITPLDAAGDDPLDRPATIIGRLARRVDLLARWMGVEVDADWSGLSHLWNDLDFDTAGLFRAPPMGRKSGREQRHYRLRLVDGALGVAGDLAPIWPILALGQICHAGRGGTAGLGRYVLR